MSGEPPSAGVIRALERPWVASLFVAGVACIAWGLSLGLGFFLDDLHNIERAVAAPWSFEGLARAFTVFDPASAGVWCMERAGVHFFRPLFVLSLKLDHAIWGATAFGYHLHSLALHALNSVLVLWLLRRVGLAAPLALLAAALFAAFPHHGVALLWISGRTEILLSTFVLASLVLYARSLVTGPTLAARFGVLVFAAAAFLTKEGAVVLPGYLLLVELLMRRHTMPSGQAKSPWGPWVLGVAGRLAPVAVLVIAYLIYRFGVMGLGEMPPQPYFVPPTDPNFLPWAGTKTLYYYFAWLFSVPIAPVAPVGLLLRYPWAIGIMALLTIGGWAFVMRRLGHLEGRWVFLLWTAGSLVPTLTVMASNHYTYLANAAVAVLGSAVVMTVKRGGLRRGVLVVTVGIFLGHMLYGYVGYRDLGATNEDIAAAVETLAPEITEGERELFLINTLFVAAHTGQRLRLFHGAKGLSTQILTISKDPFEIAPAPTTRWEGERRLIIDIPPDWMRSDLVQMFLMMSDDLKGGEVYRAGSATLVPTTDAEGMLSAIELTWPPERDMSRVIVVVFDEAGKGEVGDVRRLVFGGQQ